MTINLTEPANHPANSPLTGERIERVIEALESSLKYRNGSTLDHFIADAVKGLRELREVRKARPIHQVMYGELWRDITEEQYHDHAIHESPIRIVYAAPPAPVVPEDASGPLAHAYKELTPTFMRNHIAVFERYGIAPKDSSTVIQALRIALDGIERRAAMLQESPKGAGAPLNCRSNGKVQVVQEQSSATHAQVAEQSVDHVDGASRSGIKAASALDSLPKIAESRCSMNSTLVNGDTNGKALTITMPPLPVLGSTAEWYQGFAAGAASMRDECLHVLAAAGFDVEVN